MKFLLPVLAVLLIVACESSPPPLSDDQIERNNRGVALMGQYRNEAAREVFAGLVEERPGWVDVEVNKAIAILNRQQEGDELQALAITERILEDHPEHLRARYVAGLMRFYIGQAESALAHLQQVAEAEPDDAHVAYFTAQALDQLDRTEDALDHYQRAIELDPYLRSAYYGAALARRQLGDSEAARELLDTYRRFENNPRAHLAEFRYTRKGRLAEALAVSPPDPDPVARDPEGALFQPGERLLGLDLNPGTVSLTSVDLDGSGDQDLFVAGGPGQGNVVLRGADGGFGLMADHPLAGIEGVNAAFWGDLDNRGATDALLCREGANRVVSGADGFRADHPGSSDLADSGRCVDGAVFDADHDGDLDWFVVNADGPGELFSNNLDGSFRRLSEADEAALAISNRPGRQVIALDFDGDRDADIIVVHDQPPHRVWQNDRLWRYRDAEGFDAFRAADLVAVAAADLDASGRTDLVSLDAEGVLARWRPDPEGHWQAEELAVPEGLDPAQASLALLDLDGDGRANILIHDRSGFEVFALDVGGRAISRHRESARLEALAPVLVNPERGPALVGIVAEEDDELAVEIWRPGPGRHPFVAIAPSGLTEPGEGMRSNASGIGTMLTLRSGRDWAVADTFDSHSAPGQSLQPLAVGLGGRERADFVRLLWSDGVLQTEMDLATGEVHRIHETQRQLASCPILFAWNGERYDFVSDLLGVAGIGFFQEPGRYSEPRPWEYFKFPAGSIAPREGRYEIKIGEPMEEIAYIDTAHVQVYDLPPGWDMTIDERMHTGGGPEPTGVPVFFREASRFEPVRVIDQHDRDVAERLARADGRAAPPGPRHRHFLGRLAEEHVLTLDFDTPINPPGTRPVLVAEGWVEYPYSQTLFSAWQAGAGYEPPSLEAFADGRWHSVFEHFGYPAGMPREMSLPLSELPPETTRLRIRGNWEVYWDYLGVVHAEPPPPALVTHDLSVDQARLSAPGFARRDTLDQRRPYYDYQDRSPFWDTRHPTGRYTDFGPVEPLVATANNAFAIFGPGEELHLSFAAPGEPPAEWRREVVLEVRGFAKDMDLYTNTGETVAPLPVTDGVDTEQRDALHERFNNRFQGGR